MKKWAGILILSLVLALLLPSAALANGEPFWLFPWEGYGEATPDQEIFLAYGWSACTKGLLKSFLTSAHHTYYQDGEILLEVSHNDDLWAPMVPDVNIGCLAGRGNPAYWTFYAYSLGTGEDLGLAVGDDLVLQVELCFDHPVNDGYDGDEDGQPDLYMGCQQVEYTLHMISP